MADLKQLTEDLKSQHENATEAAAIRAAAFAAHSEAGKPGEPGEPVKPGEPGEPVKPGEPGEPVKPGEPGEPVKPGEPGKQGEPNFNAQDLSAGVDLVEFIVVQITTSLNPKIPADQAKFTEAEKQMGVLAIGKSGDLIAKLMNSKWGAIASFAGMVTFNRFLLYKQYAKKTESESNEKTTG